MILEIIVSGIFNEFDKDVLEMVHAIDKILRSFVSVGVFMEQFEKAVQKSFIAKSSFTNSSTCSVMYLSTNCLNIFNTFGKVVFNQVFVVLNFTVFVLEQDFEYLGLLVYLLYC